MNKERGEEKGVPYIYTVESVTFLEEGASL